MSESFEKLGECPICHIDGIDVPYDTVLGMASDNIKNMIIYGQYYLCVNPNCKIAYFSINYKINVNEIKETIWYKNGKKNPIICYCRNITFDDISYVIKIRGKQTPEQIVKYYGKESIPADCIHKMPTGESCDILFLKAIEFAKKQIRNQSTKNETNNI